MTASARIGADKPTARPALSLPWAVPAVPAPRGPGVSGWARRYTALLLLVDTAAAAVAVFVGWVLRFGLPDSPPGVIAYALWSVLLVAGWLACLLVTGSYETQRISHGAREYQRVLRAAFNLAASVAIIGYLTAVTPARTFLAIVLPLGVAAMVVLRYAVRKSVHRRRASGRWCSRLLAVGTRETVAHLAEVLGRNPHAGLVVVGACVEDASPGDLVWPHVPVMGGIHDAESLAERLDVDIVAVAGAGLGPRRVRELGWALEHTGRAMVMAPNLTEVAGPRVHVSPVEGLPLMWVDQPQFQGVRLLVKRVVDIAGALALIVASAPLLLLIALGVRLTSRGPAVYRSTRMGERGETFTVFKFRSMYAGAHARRGELLDRNDFTGGTLFKLRRDPRVTPFGRLLRRLSLDELPQLFNVLGGSMSLVGPRPPLPEEVAQYGPHAHRRLLVKPGMTGLWQVSGRSDLSWDETLRLDLYYVENWSLTLDLAIIARTIWVVLTGRGAY